MFGFVVYLAAFFADRFQADTPLLGLVWFIGAFASFFANVLAGRLVNGGQEGAAVRWWRDPLTLLVLSTVASVVLAPLTFLAPSVLLAIVATTVYALVHGVLSAALVSLLVRRYMSLRGPVMALNASVRTSAPSSGRPWPGWASRWPADDGLALTLVLMTGAAAITLVTALPRCASGRPSPWSPRWHHPPPDGVILLMRGADARGRARRPVRTGEVAGPSGIRGSQYVICRMVRGAAAPYDGLNF